MHRHMMGERRRALALASVMTLAVYLIGYLLAFSVRISGLAHLLLQPVPTQFLLLAPIWLGWLIFAMAQRELIAHGAGAYRFLLAITEVRGMRALGLGFGGCVIAATVAIGLLSELTPQLAIVGAFTGSALLFLGLPHAPEARYLPVPAPQGFAGHTGSARPGRGTIVDAGR